MSISATQVKELRERTGLGMMECKTALTETSGDMEAAVDLLRMKAGAKVEKKSGRTAADGAIGIQTANNIAAMVEVNSETDFVAKGDDFLDFARACAQIVASREPADVDALYTLLLGNDSGRTVGLAREELVAKFGENISVRRFVCFRTAAGRLGAYVHGRKIGVLVELIGGDETLARDLAMHIAASRPEYVSQTQVPTETIAKERAIYTEQAAASGKPANIVAKMVEGRVQKFLNEIALLGQPFVKDPDTTVEKLLAGHNATVVRFHRYEVGEGIDRGPKDFAAEVMAQVKGN